MVEPAAALFQRCGCGGFNALRVETAKRQDRLLTLAERNGTFASTFIEKLQQASSTTESFIDFANMLCIPRTNNSPQGGASLYLEMQFASKFRKR